MKGSLWAGTESSFCDYLATVKKFEAINPKDYGAYASEVESQVKRTPRLLSVSGGVGIISIQGTLTDSESWYNEFAGLVAYSEIREAVVTALSNPNIKELLYLVKTGGGTTSGLHDTYEFIGKASKLMRSTVFSNSMVASAGYYIMAPVPEKVSSLDASWGSIGVVHIHQEDSERLKKEGVKTTVTRSAPDKMSVNSVEPLTERAQAIIDEVVQYANGIFVQAVADSLQVSTQLVEKQMGGGRMFKGRQALEVGLVDSVSNFDTTLNKIQSRVNKRNEGGISMSTGSRATYAAITPESIAAIASGVSPGELVASEAGATASEVVETVVTAPEGAIPVTAAEVDAVPSAEGVVVPGGVELAYDPAPSAVDILKEQLSAKDEALLDAKMALKAAEAMAAGFVETEAKLKAIVGRAVNNMQVALSQAPTVKPEEMASATLLDLYNSVAPTFATHFKVGGVSTALPQEDKPKVVAVSRLDAAHLAAVAKK